MSNVSSLNNKTLQEMYATAKAAAESGPSRTDTVIHLKAGSVSSEFEGHAWVRLGSRSAEFKGKNLEARKLFFNSVAELFGGAKNLPESVLKEFKQGDFLLNQAGEVTSQRPLTARRVLAICEKAAEYITNNPDKLYGEIRGFDKLTTEEQAEYRAKIYEKVLTNKSSIETEGHNFSPVRFLVEKFNAQNCASGQWQEHVSSSSPLTTLRNEMVKFITHKDKGVTRAMANGQVDVDFIRSFEKHYHDLAELDQKCFGLLKGEKFANLSPREKCYAYNRILENYAAKGSFSLNAKSPRLLTFDEFVKTGLDEVIAEAKDPDKVAQVMKTPQRTIHFMRQFVEARKSEFTAAAGGINNQLVGKAERLNSRTKYDNIMQTISDCLKLKLDAGLKTILVNSVKESKFMEEWHKKLGGKKFQRNAESQDPAFKSYYEAFKATFGATAPVDMAIGSFNKFCNNKAEWDQSPSKAMSGLEYPSDLTVHGKKAEQELTTAFGVSPHAKTNTAAQILEAFDIFCRLEETFFKCLEKDETKLDNLFEAMNMPGCLQARVAPLDDFNTALEIGPITVMPTSRDGLMAGMTKMAQYLFENKVEFKYDDLVSRYLAEIGDGAKIELGSGMGTFGDTLGADKAVIMSKYGSTKEILGADNATRKIEMVRISKEFFEEPSVKGVIDAVFGSYFVEPEAEAKA